MDYAINLTIFTFSDYDVITFINQKLLNNYAHHINYDIQFDFEI
jgi:hypothetical protein